MKTITIPGFIYACKPTSTDFLLKDKQIVGGVKYVFDAYDYSDRSEIYTKVCQYALNFDLPESFNPVNAFVANLEAQKKKVRADFQARITEIDRQINQLLAIEMTEAV